MAICWRWCSVRQFGVMKISSTGPALCAPRAHHQIEACVDAATRAPAIPEARHGIDQNFKAADICDTRHLSGSYVPWATL